MSTASQIIEAEGLERPSESVEFAQYFHNHMGKTEKAKASLNKISKVTMAIALGSLFYVCFTLMSTMKFGAPAHHGGHARLRASREEDGNQMAMTLNALSVMVWGLVAAKAKTGMQAASSDDHTTVKSALKKATNLVLLIVFASFVKFGAEMSQKNFNIPAGHPTLKATRGSAAHVSTFVPPADAASPWEDKEHTPSFYDPESSHYMGGAHNVALAALSNPANPLLHAVKSETFQGARSFNN